MCGGSNPLTDQNMEKGDAVYPNHLVAKEVPVEDTTSFLKGELATIDANGFLTKLTSTKIAGIVQVRNAVTGGVADGDVTVTVNDLGTRILVNLPVNAKRGDKVQINGSDGTGNVVVSVAGADPLNLVFGTIFGLYRNSAEKATAADLGLVDMGVY